MPSELSRSAAKAKPKKPLNSYFKFRIQELKKYSADDKNRTYKVKIAFDELPDKEKTKLDKDFQKAMESWRTENDAWRKKYGLNSNERYNERSKSKGKSTSKTSQSKSKDKGEKGDRAERGDKGDKGNKSNNNKAK